MTKPLHDDELAIDPALVRKLLDGRLPEYAGLSLRRLDTTGSSNVMFRLGDELLVRLPRQPGGAASLGIERDWSAVVGAGLPVEVPEVVAMGEPGCGFGEPWSVVRWIEGVLPRVCSPEDPPMAERSQLAEDLADVILALQRADVPDAAARDPRLRNYRGRSLAAFDEHMPDILQRCEAVDGMDLDFDAARGIWREAMDRPGAHETAAPRWYHGDLNAENLLLRDGRLCAVLDFGGLGIGDPTIDLHGAWELFDAPARELFRERLGVDEATWLRGRAWALAVALNALHYYWDTMPGRVRDRLAMVRNVLADAAGGTG
jgi:aminoglycoside phosphotransferase (APT) family kinase protein